MTERGPTETAVRSIILAGIRANRPQDEIVRLVQLYIAATEPPACVPTIEEPST